MPRSHKQPKQLWAAQRAGPGSPRPGIGGRRAQPRPLEGHGALLTGAAGGIGQAIATVLAGAGADLILTDRNTPQLADRAGELRAHGAYVGIIPADLTRPGAAAHVVQESAGRLQRLDIVVNAAGLCRAVAAERLTARLWRETLAINLEIPAQICTAAAPHLRSRGGGAIVNIASVSGLRAFPSAAQYAASKAELIALTYALAAAWGSDGIRVNALCPGWTRTRMTHTLWASPGPSNTVLQRVPLGRWAAPEEIADAAFFLLTDAAAHITGTVVTADGGLLAD
ncbi:SDR family NAD(P)-dependent oxidoreductase [Streptomyces sp. NPDC059003]|uniref:SDR family NAD(P)-dependent oxidoreductase n=1 Tax=Streptomyces sp. NPDC059003 TaxID=3346691 RepID=UPI0036B3344F